MGRFFKLVEDVNEANAITHSGNFHADEVFAAVILSKVFDRIRLCRTYKIPNDVADDVIIFDIGGGELDHHYKRGEKRAARSNGIPYSAAGLVWKKYGRQIVECFENPDKVWELVDSNLIQGIDAVDNGAMQETSCQTVYDVIDGFNPMWFDAKESDAAFLKAMDVAEQIFDNVLSRAVDLAKIDRKLKVG